MANPICTQTKLNFACFDGTLLNNVLRKCLMVFFKATALNAIGGTNYLSKLISSAAGGLIGDTVALMDEKETLDEIGTRNIGQYELAIAYNTAVSLGMAAVSINAMMQQIKCLRNVPEPMLDRMIIFLDCNLGVPKAYPQ